MACRGGTTASHRATSGEHAVAVQGSSVQRYSMPCSAGCWQRQHCGVAPLLPLTSSRPCCPSRARRFCRHDNAHFASWHRPYMRLYELGLQRACFTVSGVRGSTARACLHALLRTHAGVRTCPCAVPGRRACACMRVLPALPSGGQPLHGQRAAPCSQSDVRGAEGALVSAAAAPHGGGVAGARGTRCLPAGSCRWAAAAAALCAHHARERARRWDVTSDETPDLLLQRRVTVYNRDGTQLVQQSNPLGQYCLRVRLLTTVLGVCSAVRHLWLTCLAHALHQQASPVA
jgi:hypothetical protein